MDPAWTALALSLKVAGWATALNLVLGVAVGLLLARGRFPGRDLLDTVLTLPMVMPPTVLGYYLLVLIGRHGTLGAWLHETFGINLIFTLKGAVIAATVVSFPLVFKPARAAFEAVDGQLEQAARVLGLAEAAVFFRVTLPLAWRGILAGVLLAFARALVSRPRALLLDEPFSALDPMLRATMRNELDELQLRLQVPMVLITHDPEDAAVFGEHVLNLQDGRLEPIGTAHPMAEWAT